MYSVRCGLGADYMQDDDILSCRRHFSLWMQSLCSPWEKVLSLGTRIDIKKNQQLFGDGERSNGLYYIKDGIFRIESYKANGDKLIFLYVTAKNLLGDAAFFNKMPVYATYTALTDSQVYFFSKEKVVQIIMIKYPELIENLIAYQSYKIGVLLHHQGEVMNPDIKGRVCRFLFDIAQYNGDFENITPIITQEEMSNSLGLHRATLNKAFSDLKKEGILDKKNRNTFTVYNKQMLMGYARDTFAL
jgi:CRP-like cAMP-binding protein